MPLPRSMIPPSAFFSKVVNRNVKLTSTFGFAMTTAVVAMRLLLRAVAVFGPGVAFSPIAIAAVGPGIVIAVITRGFVIVLLPGNTIPVILRKGTITPV